jgi:DNA-binding response OmpR family regulator
MHMHRNILIVDDDQDMIDLVTLILEQNGFAVASAKDGYGALDQVNNHHYDLVLLDKNMPFVTGDQVLKSLRNNQMTKNLPIIMLTASTELEDVKKSKTLGVDDYVIKPPDKKNLVERIEKLLSTRPKLDEIVLDAEQGLKLGKSAPTISILSVSIGGLILKSQLAIKKGSSMEVYKLKLLETLGIISAKLKVATCETRSDGSFELFVSFLPLNREDTEKIRDWIATKKLRLR